MSIFDRPTVTVEQKRYEELLEAETKAKQYKKAIEKYNPELVNVIEGVHVPAEIDADAEGDKGTKIWK